MQLQEEDMTLDNNLLTKLDSDCRALQQGIDVARELGMK